MNFTHASYTTQNVIIDSSGIDIIPQDGSGITLRDDKVGIGTSNSHYKLSFGEAPSATDWTNGKGLLAIFEETSTGNYFYGLGVGSSGSSIHTTGGLSFWGGTGGATPNNGNCDLFIKRDGGGVGIGTTSPEAPLHVVGTENSTGGGVWSFFGAGETTLGYNPYAMNTALIAIKSGGSIWINGQAGSSVGASYFLTSSDSRIKTEIELVNDKTALDKVNRIECKEYHYKDSGKRESVKTIGFIAQEVRDVLPNAISLQTSFVPDELRVIENIEWNVLEDKYSMTIPDLDLSSNNTGKCRFYVSNDISGNDEVMREVTVESDNKTFVFDESWNNIFFYGKEVNDFHTIDKQKIFQLHHPAIQQLSRLNDEKTTQITTLQEETTQLQQHNEALETELSTVKTQLATLEAKVNELLAKNA